MLILADPNDATSYLGYLKYAWQDSSIVKRLYSTLLSPTDRILVTNRYCSGRTIRCVSYQAQFLASRLKWVHFECSLTPVWLPPRAALKELLIVNRLYSTLLSSTDRMSASGGQLSERENWNRKKEKKERRGREDCWIAPQAGSVWGQQRERRSRGSFLGSNEAVNPTKQENSFLRRLNTKQG